jgi:uncharacterized membrane protein YhaH (DUF805 family)
VTSVAWWRPLGRNQSTTAATRRPVHRSSAPGNYPSTQSPPGGFLPAPLTYLQGAPVSFGEAISQAFRNAFVYRGRASRSAYWWFILFQDISLIALQVIVVIVLAASGTGAGAGAAIENIMVIVVGISLVLVSISLLVRRLHDTNRSAWWMLIALVPFVGAITLLIFTVQKGTPGTNWYGAQP